MRWIATSSGASSGFDSIREAATHLEEDLAAARVFRVAHVSDVESLELDAVRVRDERAAVACAPSARARLLSNVIAMVAAFGGRGPVPAGSRQQDVAVVADDIAVSITAASAI